MEMLYPDEERDLRRHSSNEQFRRFLSVMTQGGWAPIVFDQLDGIKCDAVITHPVVISWGDDLGYTYPEAHCTYTTDKYVTFDKEGVEQKRLPAIFGGNGEFYDAFVKGNSFIDFDDGRSLGIHNEMRARVGLSYVTAEETLPPVE